MDPATPNNASVAGPAIVVDPARPSVVVSGAKVPEFLADKVTQEDFAALPESARNILVEKAKSVQEDYRQKTTALASQRKSVEGLLSIQEQLEADPKLADHLSQSIKDYKAGKRGSAADLKDDWEQLKGEADADGLKVLNAIERRFSHSPVMEKLDALSQQLSQVVSGTQLSRQTTLDQELAALPQEFKTLATEHRTAVLNLGKQSSFANKSARELLGLHAMHIGQREAYEDASFAERTRKSTEEVQRARELGGFPSIAGAPETPVVGEQDWQESRDPRFGKSLKVGNVISRVFGEVKRHLPMGGV